MFFPAPGDHLTLPRGRSAGGRRRCGGFTLVELLITISIIGILASLSLVALFGAQEQAKIARTETQIAKIHELIMTKWEEYESRPVPIKVTGDPKTAATQRLNAIRELQRMEFPQVMADVLDPPDFLSARPALSSAYKRQADAVSNWTNDHGRAECLYLIISQMRSGDRKALEFFSEDEIGDIDGDGMPEILDAWGNPIQFFRWFPGFVHPYSSFQFGDQNPNVDGDASPPAETNESGSITFQHDPLGASSYDPFDPFQVDPHWQDNDPANDPFPLYPLVLSAGPDEDYGNFELSDNSTVKQTSTTSHLNTRNDPYGRGTDDKVTGKVLDSDSIVDNIHNHFLIVR